MHRSARRASARRALTAAALAAGLLGPAGCGGARQSTDGSTVAKAVTAPALPRTTTGERDPSAGVPASHAVEPVVGEDAPAINTTTVPAREREPASTDSGAAPRRGRATRGVHGILSPADRASFRRLAASLGGTSGLAVSAAGRGQRVERAGTLENAIAWSTAKVPIAMAVIAAGAGSAQQANLQGAIAASDNAAALRLWSSLGGGQAAAGAADEQLRAGGDTRTRIEARSLRGPGYTPFGQTAWALSDQTRFTAGLPCTDPGARVLGLMDEVVAGQRWGLGSAGVQAQFKGGWGPGSQPGAGGGYLDRQMGILTIHGRPLAVAIATEPVDGSHATGIRNLTAIARWIVSHVDTAGLPGGPAHC